MDFSFNVINFVKNRIYSKFRKNWNSMKQKIKIYHNPRCSKSREGLQWVENSGEEFEVVEYLKKPLNQKELKEILQNLGIQPLDLVRKKENVWLENFKDKNLSDEEIIEAILQFPVLLERPIVLKGNKAVIGRPPVLIKDIL